VSFSCACLLVCLIVIRRLLSCITDNILISHKSSQNANKNNNNNNNNNNNKELMHGDTTNVEPEMYDYTSNNLSHWGCNEKLKEKFGSCIRKTFHRLITEDGYAWNITHNTESTAV
jgi:vesicle coat complex subunit